METYENFKARNAGWNSDYYCHTEKSMQENYQIALNVEKAYNEKFGNINGPRIGDIVEFADNFRVYKHGKVVENLYGGSEYGLLCVCENGSSHTNGNYFSTSGGAFYLKHKSLFRYVGEDENVVWTWGCHGSGANQGIYFPLKVRKWIIPYEPIQVASTVRIYGANSKKPNGEKRRYAVSIENFGDFFFAQSFSSVKAFRAWADYVGYNCSSFGHGTFLRRSPQKIIRKYIWEEKDIPANGKPLKLIDNGSVREAWAVTTETAITYTLFNANVKRNSDSDDKEDWLQEHRKYDGNPLGV